MAIGSRRKRGDEYVLVDGRMTRVDDASSVVPGQAEAARASGSRSEAAGRDAASSARDRAGASAGATPGASPSASAAAGANPNASPSAEGSARARESGRGSSRQTVRQMEQDDAFALRDSAGPVVASSSFADSVPLLYDDKRKMRRKYLLFGFVLLVCMAVSCCVDQIHLGFRSPVEVVESLGTWFSLLFAQLFNPTHYAEARMAALSNNEFFESVVYQCGTTIKYAVCGIMLALSGMLYQNTFRNPIAAPSMLGVTNGINFALLILVMQFGMSAFEHIDLYFLYSYIGGLAVLVLVMLAGKWTSGRRNFNVVNMILMGMIVSQLLGVVITYVRNTFMTDAAWEAYYQLQQATGYTSPLTYITLVVGLLVSIIPIFLFRFKLNLVSFEDEETRLLGVNPNRLRLLALTCGSIMILTAQVNAGQVAMASLVVPFVVRAVFGSEFRKQLGGNILIGAIVLVVCGMFATLVIVNTVPVGLNAVVTILALPLFVWMLAIRQRSWD